MKQKQRDQLRGRDEKHAQVMNAQIPAAPMAGGETPSPDVKRPDGRRHKPDRGPAT